MQGSGVFTVTPYGKIASWNCDCEQLLGYLPAQVVKCSLVDLVADPGDAAVCAQELKNTRGAAANLTLRLRHATGSMTAFKLTVSPQYREADKFAGHSVQIDPIEPAPSTSETDVISRIPLREMVDLLPITFYILNLAGMLVLWNTRVEQVTELTHDEVAHTHALAMFNPEDKELVASRIADVFAHDGEVVVEAGLLAKSGHVTPYLFTGTRFTVGGNHYLCGMGVDLTERRQQEEKLRLRDRALHASSNGIFIARCKGATHPIEYVNPAFERITGYRAAEVIGCDTEDVCGFMSMPETDWAQRTEARRAMLEMREVRVTVRNLRKSGEVYWNDLTMAPVLDDKNIVTHFVGVINDVTETTQRTFHLEHEVNHDVLTGLANRNLMWDRLEQALHMAQRNKTLVAVIVVDLDNFKTINDTLGHEAGDEVLKVVARKMLGSVRESDTVARLGGDEFVLLLTNQPSLRYTLRMIDRLRAAVAVAVTIFGKEISIASSMGVSIFPHDGKNAVELIQSADAAMYHAKTGGRNDVHFFSPAMKETTDAKHKFEQHMREAIINNEMFLVLQPKICTRTNRIVGAEALLRWRHPQQGVLLPSAFLHEAEENGQIIPFGEWVFKGVCEILQRLKLLGFDDMVISMNVSFPEFSQRDYISLLGAKLADSAVAPKNFELEISEANLLKNVDLTHAIFDDINRLGIRVTVDEFGAGVCSLKNLQQLPVTSLKIYRSYIDNITHDNVSDMMARTIIGIGHLMNIGIIGEGVETVGQCDFLKTNGCDQMQGNYFSEPIPFPTFERMLQDMPRQALH